MEIESGQELDWFFDQWIYKPDHPDYQNVFGITSGENGKWIVHFTANQEDQAFLPYFQMPLELLVSFADGTDSLVRVFNSFNGQIFAFEFDKEPSLVVFDPNNDILLKSGTTVTGIADEKADKPNFSLTISPNPFTDVSKIGFNLDKPAFVTFELFNNTGMKIRTLSEKYFISGDHSIEFKSDGLPDGIYFVVLRTATQTESIKIIKAS
jgi:aminopeptidase N